MKLPANSASSADKLRVKIHPVYNPRRLLFQSFHHKNRISLQLTIELLEASLIGACAANMGGILHAFHRKK